MVRGHQGQSTVDLELTEVERGGRSYTYDTMVQLTQAIRRISITLLLGRHGRLLTEVVPNR